jgi:hypothetical protein
MAKPGDLFLAFVAGAVAAEAVDRAVRRNGGVRGAAASAVRTQGRQLEDHVNNAFNSLNRTIGATVEQRVHAFITGSDGRLPNPVDRGEDDEWEDDEDEIIDAEFESTPKSVKVKGRTVEVTY